ncbi:Putative ankyrin repeat-containing protein [Candidatus Phycorickettsia trachydisci]|uniref:Ankyrin repeat-containing protein n=1 Tax=Candidatus Phycorickettsia trachydisci TaxID=2115978 RepID=A0A2P1PA94_9RICK|nr:ankyrin repeat domain-containing protein [Candidatus Phycorickettsia trachydisci]AVP88191.1 Putative ankyrin repeat-containing protein [Candidatus Phycorickettsia trachydisci]
MRAKISHHKTNLSSFAISTNQSEPQNQEATLDVTEYCGYPNIIVNTQGDGEIEVTYIDRLVKVSQVIIDINSQIQKNALQGGCKETKGEAQLLIQSIKHLKIFSIKEIIIDGNLIDDKLAGCNVTIIAPKWIVTGDYSINLRGQDAKEHTDFVASNGKDPGDPGRDGEPGLAGGSGGNFWGMGTKFINLEKLTINVSGGKGGNGQKGGNGAKGQDKDIPQTKDNIELLEWVKYGIPQLIKKIDTLKSTISSEKLVSLLGPSYDRKLANTIKAIKYEKARIVKALALESELPKTLYQKKFNSFYNAITKPSFSHFSSQSNKATDLYSTFEHLSFLVIPDICSGGNASKGGKGGIGGKSGTCDIILLGQETLNCKVINESGKNGSDADHGIAGPPGTITINGDDITCPYYPINLEGAIPAEKNYINQEKPSDIKAPNSIISLLDYHIFAQHAVNHSLFNSCCQKFTNISTEKRELISYFLSNINHLDALIEDISIEINVEKFFERDIEKFLAKAEKSTNDLEQKYLNSIYHQNIDKEIKQKEIEIQEGRVSIIKLTKNIDSIVNILDEIPYLEQIDRDMADAMDNIINLLLTKQKLEKESIKNAVLRTIQITAQITGLIVGIWFPPSVPIFCLISNCTELIKKPTFSTGEIINSFETLAKQYSEQKHLHAEKKNEESEFDSLVNSCKTIFNSYKDKENIKPKEIIHNLNELLKRLAENRENIIKYFKRYLRETINEIKVEIKNSANKSSVALELGKLEVTSHLINILKEIEVNIKRSDYQSKFKDAIKHIGSIHSTVTKICEELKKHLKDQKDLREKDTDANKRVYMLTDDISLQDKIVEWHTLLLQNKTLEMHQKIHSILECWSFPFMKEILENFNSHTDYIENTKSLIAAARNSIDKIVPNYTYDASYVITYEDDQDSNKLRNLLEGALIHLETKIPKDEYRYIIKCRKINIQIENSSNKYFQRYLNEGEITLSHKGVSNYKHTDQNIYRVKHNPFKLKFKLSSKVSYGEEFDGFAKENYQILSHTFKRMLECSLEENAIFSPYAEWEIQVKWEKPKISKISSAISSKPEWTRFVRELSKTTIKFRSEVKYIEREEVNISSLNLDDYTILERVADTTYYGQESQKDNQTISILCSLTYIIGDIFSNSGGGSTGLDKLSHPEKERSLESIVNRFNRGESPVICIYNVNNLHWVVIALVIDDKSDRVALYKDSYGKDNKDLQSELLDLGIARFIYSTTNEQKDNKSVCDVFALKNAEIITQKLQDTGEKYKFINDFSNYSEFYNLDQIGGLKEKRLIEKYIIDKYREIKIEKILEKLKLLCKTLEESTGCRVKLIKQGEEINMHEYENLIALETIIENLNTDRFNYAYGYTVNYKIYVTKDLTSKTDEIKENFVDIFKVDPNQIQLEGDANIPFVPLPEPIKIEGTPYILPEEYPEALSEIREMQTTSKQPFCIFKCKGNLEDTQIIVVGLPELRKSLHIKDKSKIKRFEEIYSDLFFEDMQQWINECKELDIKDENGQTFLHHAVLNNCVKAVSLLSQQKTIINAQDNNGFTPLHLAIQNDYLSTIDLLIPLADLRYSDRDGWTALHWAAWSDNIEAMQLITKAIDNGTIYIDIDAIDNDRNTPLHLATYNGHKEVIKLLIEKKANPNVQNSQGSTPLHLSALWGYDEVVEILLDKEAKLEIKDNKGNTPLNHAAYNGHIETVKILFNKGANLNVRSHYGWTSLHYAVRNGHTETVKFLLDKGASLENADEYGWTPLTCATHYGHLNIVKELLNYKANIEAITKDGYTPILMAAREGRLDIIKELLNNKANIEVANKDGMTSLFEAVCNGHFQIAQLLLDKGADLEVKDNKEGRTLLHYAVENDHIGAVEFLLYKRINIEATTREGNTPLHLAARNGYTEIVKLLVSKGANLEVKSHYGWTPIHYAARNGYTETVKFLLDKEVSFEDADEYGWTPLLWATHYGHLYVVKELLNYKAKTDAVTQNVWPPLLVAALRGHFDIVKELLNYKANIEATTEDGYTPILAAVQGGHLDIVKELLNYKANIEATTEDGYTPILMAARGGHLDIVKELLNNKANIEAANKDGMTPLFEAVCNGHCQIAQLLLDKGANFEATTQTGDTPLHCAAKNGHTKTVESLLYKATKLEAINPFLYVTCKDLSGIEELLNYKPNIIEVRNKNGDTSLHIAAQEGHLDIVKKLLDYKANIEATNKGGWTPLLKAAQRGHCQVVQLLLNEGANIEAATQAGDTPLHYAAENGHTKTVECLLDKKAYLETTTQMGNTPLHLAAGNGHAATVKLLLDKGANIEAINNSGYTPLFVARYHEYQDVVEELLNYKANIEAVSNIGYNTIKLAGDRGQQILKNFKQKDTHIASSDTEAIGKLSTSYGMQELLGSVDDEMTSTALVMGNIAEPSNPMEPPSP